MKYRKPEVTRTVDATQMIQHTELGKSVPMVAEGKTFGTPAAYEADE
jgi:hypothetical protein